MNRIRANGFTIVELIIVLITISILAGIVTTSFVSWQYHTADTAIKSDLMQAASLLESNRNFKNSYPTSIFSYELSSDDKPSFKPSEDVTVILKTNAVTFPIYDGISGNAEVQLFLDACNSVMPIIGSGGSTYHTSCQPALNIGLWTVGISSVGRIAYIPSPINSGFTITCTKFLGSCNESDYVPAVSAAITKIKQRFEGQGGTFPISVPLFFSGATLPIPTDENGYVEQPATKFCLEGVSNKFPDRVFHLSSSSPREVIAGSCPSDSSQF